jgi:heme exporter protein B
MMAFVMAIVKRDLLLILRQPADILNPLVFFILVVALFPLGVSPEASILAPTAAGIVWVAAMLATLLSLELMFKLDHEDGSLEQLLLAPYPGWSLVLAKVLVHWLISGLPLVLLSPLIASMLFLPLHALPTLMLSLLIGTPTLSLFGAIGAALVTGVRGGGMLLTILILPLYVPVIIFGAASVAAAVQGMPIDGYMAILGAMLVFALMITPWASSAALKL